MDSAVASALIGAISAIAGTILGAKVTQAGALKTARDMQELERHKYTHDRLWDARKEAYTAIVFQLRTTARAAEKLYAGLHDQYGDPEEYFQSEQYNQDSRTLWETWRGTVAEYEKSRLLLSDAFSASFETIQAGVHAVDEDAIPPDRAEAIFAVFDDAVAPLTAIAKSEIAPSMPVAPAR